MNNLLGEIAQQQEWLCFWCKGFMQCPIATGGQQPSDVTIDHVIPRWLGGDKRRSNIVAACRACNSDRGGMHQADRPDPTGFNKWFKRRIGYEPRRFVIHEGKTLSVRSIVLRRLAAA